MTPASNSTLWTLALVASLAIHGGFAAGILLLPAPETQVHTQTMIEIQGVPDGRSQAVAAPRHIAAAKVLEEAAEGAAAAVTETTALRATNQSRKAAAATPERVLRAKETIQAKPVAVSKENEALSAVEPNRSIPRRPTEARDVVAASSVSTDAAAAPAPPPSAAIADSAAPPVAVAAVPTQQRAFTSAPAVTEPAVAPSPSGAAKHASKPTRLALSRTEADAVARTETEGASPARRTTSAAAAASSVSVDAVTAMSVERPASAHVEAAQISTGEAATAGTATPQAVRPSASGPTESVSSRSRTSVARNTRSQADVAAIADKRAGAVRAEAVSRPVETASSPGTASPSGGGSDAPVAASSSAASLIAAARPHTEPAATGASTANSVSPTGASARAAGEEVAMLVPNAPSAAAPKVEEVDPYQQMLDYLLLRKEDPCFLALASDEQGPSLGLDGFSGSPNEVRQLGKNLVDLTGVPVEARAHMITRDQCGALSFARSLPTYPVPALRIRPDVRTIDSGAYLSGRIENVGHNMLYLLLVDDEGKVEEVHELFKDGDAIGFDAPMTLQHGPVATVQILVALASERPLDTVTAYDGEQADKYFDALADEISRTDNTVDFGFTYFFVR